MGRPTKRTNTKTRCHVIHTRAIEREHVPGVRTLIPKTPATRGDCVDGERPCLHLLCRHNLSVDVMPAGGITIWHPGDEPGTVEPPQGVSNCALDYADAAARGDELTLREIGELTGVVRERVRQIEAQALLRLLESRASRGEMDRLREMAGHDTSEATALPGSYGRPRNWDEV